MYIYDGSRKVFGYNVGKNSWEWPQVEGDWPSKRFDYANIIYKDTVLVFGGGADVDDLATNSLFLLDMGRMRWREVPDVTKCMHCVPCARWGHSLTRTSETAAVLVGGVNDCYDDDWILEDCWIINLEKAVQATDMSSIWTQVQNINLFNRSMHNAVVEPVNNRLWLIGGGFTGFIPSVPLAPEKLRLRLNVASLKTLASECVANNTNKDDSELGPGQLPRELRKEIEAFRAMKF